MQITEQRKKAAEILHKKRIFKFYLIFKIILNFVQFSKNITITNNLEINVNLREKILFSKSGFVANVK